MSDIHPPNPLTFKLLDATNGCVLRTTHFSNQHIVIFSSSSPQIIINSLFYLFNIANYTLPIIFTKHFTVNIPFKKIPESVCCDIV